MDDQEFNLIPIEVFLHKYYKLKVNKAKDGCFAVEKFKELAKKPCCSHSYKIILMDINMPVMDGVTATRQILEYCRLEHVTPPIVCALTAYDNEENRKNCLEVGMTKVLYKPLNFNEFKGILQQYYLKEWSTKVIYNYTKYFH